jgi:hypothetical protein
MAFPMAESNGVILSTNQILDSEKKKRLPKENETESGCFNRGRKDVNFLDSSF